MVVKNHFEDCPYNCNQNGMLLDFNTGKMVSCPHCSKKKKELLAKGLAETEENEVLPLSTILGIENAYLSEKFLYDVVVPEGESVFIEQESLDWQKEIAEDLYLSLSVGNLPEYSMCFGISIKGRIDRFVYPMLAKAYLSGITVGKFISCSEFNRMLFKMDDEVDNMYSCDLLMMLINDGSNLAELSSAKGLMQTRALRGKPTIFVTTWTIEACSGLLCNVGEKELFLAKPVFLKYKSSKNNKSSHYINNLLGVENEKLNTENEGVSLDDL